MNHPHEQQAAAMARAGELPDGEQLRSGNLCEKCKCADWCAEHGCWALTECINSGQVSAAQVVAHAEAGDLPVMPDPKLYPAGIYPYGVLTYSADQMREYAEAHAAQYKAVTRQLREALEMAVRQNSHDMLMTGEEIRKCEAALTATQEPQA